MSILAIVVNRTESLGGRIRHVCPEAERARVNVTRTLPATLERISQAAPRAGAHLQASIRTGRACRYEPGPGGRLGRLAVQVVPSRFTPSG